MPSDHLQKSGIEVKLERHGIDNTEKTSRNLYSKKTSIELVLGVVKRLCHILKQKMFTVTGSANSSTHKSIDETLNVHVKNVEQNLCGAELKLPVQTSVGINGLKNKNLRESTHVDNVVEPICKIEKEMGSAQVNANETMIECQWENGTVMSAENYINQVKKVLNTAEKNVVKDTVISSKSLGRQPVYNFEVMNTHNYILESGVVVHNCDCVSQVGLIDYIKARGTDTAAELEPEMSKIWGSFDDDDDEINGSTIF
jgi:hypothetical protein